MKRFILLVVSFIFALQFTYGQKVTITGKVTSKEDGLPIIGASVMEKGTTNGTVTNFDGVYSISISANSMLIFSYIGMEKVEIKPSGSASINVVLKSSAESLDEVVVTAMGIKQEKKKLNFAVQSINSDDLTQDHSANFVNSLQGKVAGVSVTNSGGSANAGSQIIIRGISSVNGGQPNGPLYIVDGMPISSGGSNINPNDIENITILKGAAASALYGQEAAGGAIMITTKQGVAGAVVTSFKASLQTDNAVRLPQIQQKYGPGSVGFYRPLTGGGWGPLLNSGERTYNNIENYFQTGIYQKYDLSMAGGSDKFKVYGSANYSSNQGIVPNDYLKKLGLMIKATFQINSKVSGTISSNVINKTYRGAGDILSSVYSWPINDDITNYKNADGSVRFRYLSESAKENSPISPLWSRNMDSNTSKSTQTLLQGTLSYKPIKNLDITGRVGYDQSNSYFDGYTVPKFDDSFILPELNPDSPTYSKDLAYQNSVPFFTEKQLLSINKDLLGTYDYNQGRSQLLAASAIATYKIELNRDFNVEILGGTELKMREGISSTMAGRDFIIPGIYSMSNVNEVVKVLDATLEHTKRRIAGVFGEVRGDYKGLATLSVTSRWDWSSTIEKKYNPYYYPSITGGLLVSELFNLTNDWFSYGKIRANWARVGKDANPYQFDRKFTQYPTLPDGGYGADPSKSVASNLLPEISDSWEIGFDTRFFENRTRLDVAYYSTYVDNQIVTVRVSPASGYILQTRNEGSIKNHGIEFTLEQDILKKKDVALKAAVNFGLNRGVVVDLPDDIVEITGTQYGDIFPTAYLHGSTTAISGKDYLRTPDGKVICDANGYPKINPTKGVVIGNREPDFLMGFSANLRVKDFSLSFLFDTRKGGDVVNVTGRGLWTNGQQKDLEFYRGRQVVWDGVVQKADGTYVKNTTPIVLDYTTISENYTAVSSNFIEDGSYIRLSYVTLEYDFSKYFKKTFIKGLRCSLTGSNLFLLTKYTGSDPQTNASTTAGGTGGMGIDNFPVPSVRSFNFTLSANF